MVQDERKKLEQIEGFRDAPMKRLNITIADCSGSDLSVVLHRFAVKLSRLKSL